MQLYSLALVGNYCAMCLIFIGNFMYQIRMIALSLLVLSSMIFSQSAWKGDIYPLDYCVVTGKKLASIKRPISFNYKGREIKFYNQECINIFKKNARKYIRQINKEIIKQQLKHYPLKKCVVSGELLEKPITRVYKNRLIRFCCKGCIKDFKKNPGKYMKKLDKAVIVQQKPHYKLNICVVMEDELGGEMGEPIDFVHGNKLIRFCCKGCIKKFRRHPTKYTALLPNIKPHKKHHKKHNHRH